MKGYKASQLRGQVGIGSLLNVKNGNHEGTVKKPTESQVEQHEAFLESGAEYVAKQIRKGEIVDISSDGKTFEVGETHEKLRIGVLSKIKDVVTSEKKG